MNAFGCSDGAVEIRVERYRQIVAEGLVPEHDDQHTDGELIEAALAYATLAAMQETRPDVLGPLDGFPPPTGFGWPSDWTWKPADTARQNLIKAGALIAAEIDRLDRAEANRVR